MSSKGAAPLPTLGWWGRVLRALRGDPVVGAEVAGSDAAVATRQSLKAAVARKRRNDRVRQQELNLLREAMRARWLAEDRSASAAHSSNLSQLSVLPSVFDPQADEAAGKSRTIEQIARIEAQMSRHEGAVKTTRIAAAPTAHGSGLDLTRATHLRAHPDTRTPLPIDVVTTEPHAGGNELQAALSHPDLTQAAQGFAQGQDEHVQSILRALLVQEVDSLVARVAALALLDLFHARNQFEAFEEFAAEFAERFEVPVPCWPSAGPQSAQAAPQPSSASSAMGQAQEPASAWRCPLFLDLKAVRELEQVTAAQGGAIQWLDWTGLLSADQAAAQALLEVVQGWMRRPLELRFVGSAVLRRRLKASTPSGRSETDPLWWLLRLDLLCTLQRRDEYDLVALDYCVSYGVPPPPWQPPLCRCAAAEQMPPETGNASAARSASMPAQRAAQFDATVPGLQWPVVPATVADPASALRADWPGPQCEPQPQWPRLSGSWRGELAPALRAELDAALEAALPSAHGATESELVFVLDCHALLRLDLAAASGLMQWLLAARQRGVALQLEGLSRLLALYLHILGFDEVAQLRLRQY